jgi:hypothetical protein
MDVTEALFYLDQHYSDEWQRMAALIPSVDDIRRRVEALDWWATKAECLECLDVTRACLNPDTSRITLDRHFNRFDWIRSESKPDPNDQCFLAVADPAAAQRLASVGGVVGAVLRILVVVVVAHRAETLARPAAVGATTNQGEAAANPMPTGRKKYWKKKGSGSWTSPNTRGTPSLKPQRSYTVGLGAQGCRQATDSLIRLNGRLEKSKQRLLK